MRLAEVCSRYAALLDSGISAREVDLQLVEPISQLDDEARARLERSVAYGRNLGIPLAELLRGMAHNANEFERRQRELRAAFAAPSSTAKIVTGLPLLSIAMAQLAGLNPIKALAFNPLAQISAGFGAVLLALGWFAMRRLIARATPTDSDPGQLLELFAQSLLAGLPARASLAATKNEIMSDHAEPDFGMRTQIAEAERLLEFSLRTGGALRQLVLASAELARSENFARQRMAIDRLSIRLMLPLGLVVLPAFVLVGVVPAAIGMFAG
ncbi:MAG: hypothetical protein KGL77_04970 [Actinomycetales bacterium]|nr:hypothetical protein [Actinomycetales bacterium]